MTVESSGEPRQKTKESKPLLIRGSGRSIPVPRWVARLLLAVGTFGLCMALLEGVLRCTKEPPWKPDTVPFRVEPGGKLYEDDPLLGYRLKPGRFTVFMADGFPVETTHGPDGERTTAETSGPAGRPEIWVFGCSYTYGWSVQDRETFPWLLQEAIPGKRIRNFGVPGYGDLSGLLRMRTELQEGKKPAMVVLAYASFHDERNAGLRRWQKTLIRPRDGNIGPQAQPRARLDPAGNLKIAERPEALREIPGMRTWSIPHSIEKRWNRIEANAVPVVEISRKVIERMSQEAGAAGAGFLLAGIENDKKTRAMLDWWRAQGGQAVDLSVDLDGKDLRNHPHDVHPGPKAHRIYAEKLGTALKS